MIHLLYVYFFFFFICQRKLYLLKKRKKKGNNKYLLYKSKHLSFFSQNGEHGYLCGSHRGDLSLWCGDFGAIIHLFAKELHDACAELIGKE